MTEARPITRLGYCAIFAALCGSVVFVRLLPLNAAPGGWPPPDLMTALVVAWVIRRPDLIPVWAIAAVFFLADLALMRPPGLWAALVVAASEALRRRHGRLRAMSLAVEVALFAALFAALVVANWLVLAVLMVDQPPLAAQALQMPLTIAAYPAIVLVLQSGLGLRRDARPDRAGRRLRA